MMFKKTRLASKSYFNVLIILSLYIYTSWLFVPLFKPLFQYLKGTNEEAHYFLLAVEFIIFLIWVSFTMIILKLILTKYSNNKIERAANFVKNRQNDNTEYCLLLRPFGNDSEFSALHFMSENKHWMLQLANLNRVLTAESMIEELIKNKIGINTYCLVDPENKVLPASPMFLTVKPDNWKIAVDKLTKRAYLVIFLLPRGENIRESLLWELFISAMNGLLGRILIILPPIIDKFHHDLIQQLRSKLGFISHDIDGLSKKTICFYINEEGSIEQWVIQDEIDMKRTNVRTGTYKKAITGCIELVINHNKNKSFDDKYKFRNERFEEYIDKIDMHQMKVLLNIRKGD